MEPGNAATQTLSRWPEEGAADLRAVKEGVIRIVIVYGHMLPRLGLVRLLESMDGTRVVAHTGSGKEGVKLAQEFDPDVVLIEAEMADDEDMSIVEQTKARAPRCRILLAAEMASHSQIERALEAGADGYTLLDIDAQELLVAMRRLQTGDTVLHPEAASVLARTFTTGGRSKSVPLTPRQREILRLIADGLENKQIARKLGIGVHTVKTHVSRVLHKLGAASRTEAVVLAMKERLIS